jgi:superfamily II DNA/RNA helicase
LHRVGRTGRFGTYGIGLTLLGSQKELKYLQQIQEYYKCDLEEITCLNDLLNQFKDILSKKF